MNPMGGPGGSAAGATWFTRLGRPGGVAVEWAETSVSGWAKLAGQLVAKLAWALCS